MVPFCLAVAALRSSLRYRYAIAVAVAIRAFVIVAAVIVVLVLPFTRTVTAVHAVASSRYLVHLLSFAVVHFYGLLYPTFPLLHVAFVDYLLRITPLLYSLPIWLPLPLLLPAVIAVWIAVYRLRYVAPLPLPCRAYVAVAFCRLPVTFLPRFAARDCTFPFTCRMAVPAGRCPLPVALPRWMPLIAVADSRVAGACRLLVPRYLPDYRGLPALVTLRLQLPHLLPGCDYVAARSLPDFALPRCRAAFCRSAFCLCCICLPFCLLHTLRLPLPRLRCSAGCRALRLRCARLPPRVVTLPRAYVATVPLR